MLIKEAKDYLKKMGDESLDRLLMFPLNNVETKFKNLQKVMKARSK